MTGKRNGAASAAAGGFGADSSINSLAALMQAPASSFLVSQRLALEAARFWAQRMRAYADQMEALARCTSPTEIVSAQSDFIKRMQDDYVSERAAMSQLVAVDSKLAGEAASAEKH